MHWSDLPFLRGVGVESSEFKTYDMLEEDKEVKSIAGVEFLEERGREGERDNRRVEERGHTFLHNQYIYTGVDAQTQYQSMQCFWYHRLITQ